MRKKLLISLMAFTFVGALLLFINPGSTKNVSYYSGDAIYFKDKLFVSSTNSNSLEVFKLTGDSLERIAKVQAVDSRFNTYKDFNDSRFNVEGDKLYIYAVSEYSLYKYQVIDFNSLVLEKKVKNNSWEWYNRVDKFGQNIVTIGPKGVRVWSSNMDIINAYDISNIDNPYNITASSSNNYIFNLLGDKLYVIDKNTRQTISTITVNFKQDLGNRKIYFNPITEKIFVVDDFLAKKYNVSGTLEANFQHLSYPGYDVSSISNGYIYFSNGLGIVKLNQSDLSLISSQETVNLGGAGGWAMGLKMVNTVKGEKAVVFNGSNILVLDQNLNKIASILSGNNDELEIKENLFLNLSHTQTSINSQVSVSGGGFATNETIIISIEKENFSTQTDILGRFEKIITIPNLKAGRTDIKAVGQESGRSYSISIEIL